MRILFIFFILFSLNIHEQAEANGCGSVIVTSKFIVANDKMKMVGFNSQINKEKDDNFSLKLDANNVYKNDSSYNAKEKQVVNIDDNEDYNEKPTVKDKSIKEIQKIITAINEKLKSHGYNVVDSNADISIILSSDYLYYDSISGDSFDKIEYSIESKGDEEFSGIFTQATDCKNFFGLSKCNSKKISEKLSKKILINLMQLCNEN